ncbi:MAG: aryl-sulfate sulfotransferase [Deltaproteobacteria bacterium]|nr:aryl-sulfate sulfotransferase [Deltaproteobacteria bacterium]
MLGLLGCAVPDDTGPGHDPPCTASAVLMEYNPLGALVTARCTRPVDLQVAYGEAGDLDRSTPVRSAGVGVTEVEVLGLRPDRTVELSVEALDEEGAWEVATLEVAVPPLPDAWAGCEVSSVLDDPPWTADEVVCFPAGHDEAHRPLRCFDRSGETVWALSLPEGMQAKSFRGLDDGSLVLVGGNSNRAVLVDAASRVKSNVTSFDFGTTRYAHDNIDGHDVSVIKDGPWTGMVAFLTAAFDRLPSGRQAVGSGIVVFDPVTREVVWDWSLHGELGDGEPISPNLDCSNPGNCLYVNALAHEVDEDDRQSFWIERNNESQIHRVDIESGQVLWSLGSGGDFRLVDDLDAADPADLPDEGWPTAPHGLVLLGRSGSRVRFMLHDNAGAGLGGEDPGFSRVMEYEIDESTLRATIRLAHGGPDAPLEARWFSPSGGSVQLLPDEVAFLFLKSEADLFVSDVAYPEGSERWRIACEDWRDAHRMAWFPSLYEMR